MSGKKEIFQQAAIWELGVTASRHCRLYQNATDHSACPGILYNADSGVGGVRERRQDADEGLPLPRQLADI